jgi:pyrroline-5-carboxylate reductase
MNSIAFIGGGNMASCLIAGLLANGYRREQLSVSDPGDAARRNLQEQHQITVSNDNCTAVRDADVVVLAVKPQLIANIAQDLSAALKPGCAVVSIAAGVPLSALEDWMGGDTAIVRAMPNTPAMVLNGATGLFANNHVSSPQRQSIEQIFNAVGCVCWLQSEKQVNAVTAVSGSGPAYFFLLFEIMQRAAEELGLPAATARELVLQTARGATEMAQTASIDPAELRRQVTSPGGTTQRALETLDQGGLEQLVKRAMYAAVERAEEMSNDHS